MTAAERPELSTWISLNEYITQATEEECFKLLEAEKKGKRRRQFLLRIHSRLNRVRAIRERHQIDEAAR